MRHIQKQQEPASLRQLRQTEGAAYTGPQTDWQEALLAEQGHLCAYCLSRISLERSHARGAKPKMEIEHHASRESSPDLQLIWRNMLGVCNGDTGLKPHCDKAAGGKNPVGTFVKGKHHGDVTLARLNPVSRTTSEDLLTYSLSGEIKSINGNPDVEDDLNFRLNLNDEKLVQFRKDQLDRAKDLLIKKHTGQGQWTQRVFDQEIEYWSTPNDGKFKPYFKVVVWFLEWMKTRPRYR